MSWRTNYFVVRVRGICRFLGFNRIIAAFITGDRYEEKYCHTLLSSIKTGDCVWDVGANVGLYTEQFSDRVKDSGFVYAFEPSDINYAILNKKCGLLKNVSTLNIGLGESDEFVYFSQGDDELGATSRVSLSATTGRKVDIRAGRCLLRDGIARQPNVLKVDVEGFEWEVIQGMGNILEVSSLKLIGIEMHFRLLSKNGKDNVPSLIEQRLIESGFIISWPDSSHLIGIRDLG